MEIDTNIPPYSEVKITKGGTLCFEGSSHFRQRIVCATLTSKPIRIDDIRLENESPGVKDYEVSFLNLVEKLTNGCSFRINATGTQVNYKPGIIVGGKIKHECPNSRGIGYFLEGILPLAPFAKQAVTIVFTGVTNSEEDISVDLIRTVTLPILKNFGLEDIQLKIKKRGAPPNGGGEVIFTCPIVKELKPVLLVEEGKIRRIRGIAYTTRVAPSISSRIIDAARSILNKYHQDIFIYADNYKGMESGLSAGYAIALVAESTGNCILSAEAVASPGAIPEDLGKKAANLLLSEVLNRGCVDSAHQSLVLLFMVLCPETISKVRIGKITPYTIQYLRHIKDFFGVTFKLEADPDTMTVICTCRGYGFKNIARKVF